MFHTFQTELNLQGADGDGLGKRSSASRRISTNNACMECRRRKIRCDGLQPCGQCQWYQHPEACAYSKPAHRVMPSRKLVDKLSSNLDQYKTVMSKLYGNANVAYLASLSREELLQQALSSPPPDQIASPTTSQPRAASEINTVGSDGAGSLEALERAPPEEPVWDEARKHQLRVQGISDDVNGLSMSVDKLSSYVGISSITAALKVIVRCAPQVNLLITHSNQETAMPSRASSPPPDLVTTNPLALPPPDHGHELLESYFERVHPFFPLIDERKFWFSYLRGNRTDSQWLALLNIVFALGSLASSTADNEAHHIYFSRSRKHLSLESFGSGSLETLQALAIMSGYYMHYLNRPNEAHSLMGGTLRMATALGLHREYSERSDSSGGPAASEEESISPEMRRRIWWSLFCLDAWASTTTGRPSLGRMGPSITVMRPGTAANAVPTILRPTDPQYVEQLKLLPITHASTFCQIATKIQDRLVESPLLPFSETAAYDAQILEWFEGLPSVLSNHNEPCPPFLHRVRLIMKWRFHNIRIVLHRPILLTTSLRRCTWSALSQEEKSAIAKCRAAATTTINEIARDCLPDLISGWNAVWLCFQACMVPLVSLFSDPSVPRADTDAWAASIETALAFFASVADYSIAAKRSRDAVSRIYNAYKMNAASASANHTPTTSTSASSSTTPTTNPNHPLLQLHHHCFPSQNPYSQQPIGAADMSLPPSSTVPYFLPDDAAAAAAAAAASMPGWPGAGTEDVDANFLNYFWDDMMWDTNLPDMHHHHDQGLPGAVWAGAGAGAGVAAGNEYDFAGAAQDSGIGGAYWEHGN